jgi:hypothetical protein
MNELLSGFELILHYEKKSKIARIANNSTVDQEQSRVSELLDLQEPQYAVASC